MKNNIYHNVVFKCAAYVGAFAIMGLLPLFVDDLFLLNQISQYSIYALLAVSVSVVWGYGGILSLGQGIAFGLAAYGMAMTMQMQSQDPVNDPIPSFMLTNSLDKLPLLWEPFWSTPVGLLLALAVPTVFFIVFGAMMFQARVAGVFVAIMTLAMCAAWYNMAYDMQPFTAGFNGISPPGYFEFMGFVFDPYTAQSYWVCTGVLAVITLLLRLLLATKFGTISQAIREDAERARFLGYNVPFYQVVLFSIAGFVAACAGLLWVMVTQYVSPTALELSFSIAMVIWAAVGGRASLLGAAFGAILINALQSYVGDEFQQTWLLFIGSIFILVVLFLPKGLAGLVETVLGLFSREDLQAEDSAAIKARSGSASSAKQILHNTEGTMANQQDLLAEIAALKKRAESAEQALGGGAEGGRYGAVKALFTSLGRQAKGPDDVAVAPYLAMDDQTFAAVSSDLLSAQPGAGTTATPLASSVATLAGSKTPLSSMRLTGYADNFGVNPGGNIRFYVNCDGPAKYRVDMVKMIHADTNPRGPGLIEEKINATCNGEVNGRRQVIYSGSYGYLEDRSNLQLDSFTMQAWIWPTMPKTHPRYWKHGAQAIMGKWSNGKGFGLFIDETGCLELRVNDRTVKVDAPIRDHAWHFVAATYDAVTGVAVVYHEPQIIYALDPVIPATSERLGVSVAHIPGVPFTVAASTAGFDSGPEAQASVPAGIIMDSLYNGKIDNPRLCSRALSREEIETMKLGAQPGLSERRHSGPSGVLAECIVGSWDFSDGINTLTGRDQGPYRYDLQLVNCPTRAMTGHNFSGHNFDWKHAPKEYGAIHFHDDDLDDARWSVDFEWSVPAGQPSAFYAAKLTTDEGDEEYIPFWVVPELGKATAKIAVMVPTISYMAYANEHLANNAGGAELLVYRVPIMQDQNMFLSEHREYGGSIYDTHTDGSGLCLSSRLRPILSMRPKYDHFLMQAPWQYPADLHLIYWLEKMGYDYDCITDEDVTYEGLARLEQYNVIITGSHPEHNTGTQLDALHNYTQKGGRLMYMGADAWYWVHSYHPGYEHLGRGVMTEMRRCESGIRTWRADPGEYYHQGTGELGGMWRYRGRYLQSVAGTGMFAEGFDISTYYTRTYESNDERVSWAFEGIEYEEKLGNFGLVGGGAAGTELDGVDTMLGSPPHVLVVATSAGRHTEGYLLVTEEFGFNQQGLDGTQHPRVRSDIAFHETPNGGGCFAFSSIAFCGSLPWNNGDNNISKLVGNVLNRFMQDGPLPPPPKDAIVHRGRADYDPPMHRQLPPGSS